MQSHWHLPWQYSLISTTATLRLLLIVLCLIVIAEPPHGGCALLGSPEDRALAPLFAYDDDQERRLTVQPPRRRDVTALGNNQFAQGSIKPGETQLWYFPESDVMGERTEYNATNSADFPDEFAGLSCPTVQVDDASDGAATVYLSLTACSKPSVDDTLVQEVGEIPQLETFISTSGAFRTPGPGQEDSRQQQRIPADEGYLCTRVYSSSAIFIAVSAPNTTTPTTGAYDYQLAVSIDGLFHRYNDSMPILYLVDADDKAALLVTANLTAAPAHQLMNNPPPFTMMAHSADSTAIGGLQRSYCALDRYAEFRNGNAELHSDMTTRGVGHPYPKAQFYLTGLNRSSTYYGFLAVDGNSTNSGNGIIGGGGKIFRPMNFSTKAGMTIVAFCR